MLLSCSTITRMLSKLEPREVSAHSVMAECHTVITTQIWISNYNQIWIFPFACGALIKMKLLLGGGPDLRITPPPGPVTRDMEPGRRYTEH